MANLYADFTLGDEGNAGTQLLPLKYAVGMGSSTSGKSLSAGDSMLLKRGETWLQFLDAPSAGESGNQIIIGNYGTGALPILDGSDVFSGFSTEAGTVETEVTPATIASGDDGYNKQDGTYFGASVGKILAGNDGSRKDLFMRFVLNVPQGSTIVSAKITVTARATTGNGLNSYIAAVDEDDAAAPTNNAGVVADKAALTTAQVDWNLVANISANATADTPDITTIVQEIVNRASWAANNHILLYVVDDGTSTGYVDLKEYDTGAGIPVLSVTYETTGADLYYKAYSTEPKQVFFDGTKLAKVALKASLATGKWWLDGDNTRVYLFDDPTGHTVTFSQRNYCLQTDGNGYLTIDGIQTQHANSHGMNLIGASAGLIVQNCTSTYNFGHGIMAYSTDDGLDNGLLTNNTATYNGGEGIQVSRNADTWTVSHNTVHHNCIEDEELYHAGIKILGTSTPKPTNITVEYNHVYSNGDDTDQFRGCGIWADTVGTGIIVRYNLVHDNATQGIEVEKTIGAKVYYNLVYNHTNYHAVNSIGGGIIVLGNSETGVSTDNEVYNNTIYNCRKSLENAGNNTAGTCVDNIFKNNISVSPSGTNSRHLSTWGGGENDGTNGSGNVYENNCFGAEPLRIAWPAGSPLITTYADFDTAYGGATHSVAGDPLFFSTSDFHLQAASPCRDAGVDVSLTQDYAGHKVPFGTAPDVGAYEFAAGGIATRRRRRR